MRVQPTERMGEFCTGFLHKIWGVGRGGCIPTTHTHAYTATVRSNAASRLATRYSRMPATQLATNYSMRAFAVSVQARYYGSYRAAILTAITTLQFVGTGYLHLP